MASEKRDDVSPWREVPFVNSWRSSALNFCASLLTRHEPLERWKDGTFCV